MPRIKDSPHSMRNSWLVAADGGQAHIYAFGKTGKHIPLPGKASQGRHHYREIEEVELIPVISLNAQPAQIYDFDPKRRGRVFESASPTRHAVHTHTTPRQEARKQFLRNLVDYLSAARRKNSFQRLILAAPSKALGEIKAMLPETVQRTIIAEIPKDCTKLSPQALAKRMSTAV